MTIICPLCKVDCTDADPETGEPKCPGCRRVWYPTGNGPELASRGRTESQIIADHIFWNTMKSLARGC